MFLKDIIENGGIEEMEMREFLSVEDLSEHMNMAFEASTTLDLHLACTQTGLSRIGS